jgi:hypothetical protein
MAYLHMRALHATGNRIGEEQVIRHACRTVYLFLDKGLPCVYAFSTTPPPETKDERSLRACLRALQVTFRCSAPAHKVDVTVLLPVWPEDIRN